MGLLDLTAPQTAFSLASEYVQNRNLQGYSQHTVSLNGGLVQTIEGVGVETLRFSDFDGREIDTIVVTGPPDIERELAMAGETVEWIREASIRARRTSSVCTGTFFLAQAGLLENKRVATHWTMCDRLQQLFPTLEVDSRAIFVQQGPIWTSAGYSSAIDLALAMIGADCGRRVAMHIAREMVVFLMRPGSQAQHSEMLQAQSKNSAAFDELHFWLSDNLGIEDLGVTCLAEQVGMSPRNFARIYKQKTGRPPGKTIELFRLEAAQRLLENSKRNLDQIALQCGFADQGRMRATFQRNLGVTPSDYRKRFTAT
jgi:transcriptional regulator GlxA family with amidase domain